MLMLISKFSSLDKLTIIMQIFTIVITTFVFDGRANLSQESSTHVNTLTTHQQDRL